MTQRATKFDFNTILLPVEVFYLSDEDIAFCSNADPLAWLNAKPGWYWHEEDMPKMFGPFVNKDLAIKSVLSAAWMTKI